MELSVQPCFLKASLGPPKSPKILLCKNILWVRFVVRCLDFRLDGFAWIEISLEFFEFRVGISEELQ